jgi:hypothetical protein
LWNRLDGNWIDICTLIFSVLYMAYKWSASKKAGRGYKLISKRAGRDLAGGTAYFPLFVLGMSLFSSALLTELLQANKMILSVAGFFALFALLEDEQDL